MTFIARIPAKTVDLPSLLRQVAGWRLEGKKVVFTNGVFDIIHRGHIDYLMKAADLGQVLIIGLNSDSSVKLLNKGKGRPIQDQETRALILSAFAFVSSVVIFNEKTPENLITLVKPDILVKGGDYKISEIAGSDSVAKSGGQIITIPLVEGHSTTSIEERIRNSS